MNFNEYIRAVTALDDSRLYVELHSGSSMTVDFEELKDTIKYCQLKEPQVFRDVYTDGTRIFWGCSDMSITIKELMDVALIGV